jgi:hypothetical protein
LVYQCESQPEQQLREVVQAAHRYKRGHAEVNQRPIMSKAEVYFRVSISRPAIEKLREVVQAAHR